MSGILRRGDRGDNVRELQRLLFQLGYNPGPVDGIFGLATEAAVLAFQKSRGLLPDGIVGPRSWSALGHAREPVIVECLSKLDISTVSAMFPHTSIRPIIEHLPVLIEAFAAFDLIDKPLILTALATIRAETEGFEPIDEMPSRYNSSPDGHPFDLYDLRADLGNQGKPDGARFRGRGFVQLTGRDNYKRFGEAIGMGLGLMISPEKANEPKVAAQLLSTFVMSRSSSIKRAVIDNDLRRVRRLVNGGSHGLSRFVDAYRIGDKLLEDPIWRPLVA